MTIKDFARKYNVPYYLAYEASFGLEQRYPFNRDKGYIEEQMRDNLLFILKKKKWKAEMALNENQRMIDEVNRIASGDR